MQDDERCCGTGTCIINAEGVCWCGQKWDGEKCASLKTKTCRTAQAQNRAATRHLCRKARSPGDCCAHKSGLLTPC